MTPVLRGKALESMTALALLLWGLWTLLPFWDVFVEAPVFAPLGRLAPEEFWGGFALLLGAAQLFFASTSQFKVRQVLTVATMFVFVVLSLASLFGNYRNTAVVIYAVMAAEACLAYTRVTWQTKHRRT